MRRLVLALRDHAESTQCARIEVETGGCESPKERVAELVRAGKGELFDPGHGRLMKEWIAVDGAPASWLPLAREALHFVRGK